MRSKIMRGALTLVASAGLAGSLVIAGGVAPAAAASTPKPYQTPKNVSVTVGVGKVTVEWGAVTNLEKDPAGIYEVVVYRSDETVTKHTTSTRKTIKNLQPGRTYRVKIRAIAQDETAEKARPASEFSEAVRVTTQLPKPARVAKPKVKALDNGLKASWKKASNAKKYQVFLTRKQGKSFVKVKTVTTKKREITVKNLAGGERYRVQVRAVNSNKPGKKSKAKAVNVWAKATFPMELGMRGSKVKQVQQRLTWLGYPTKKTGKYDAQTQANVRKMQSKYTFPVNGNIGPQAWSKLKKVTKSKGKLPAACTNKSTPLMYCVDMTQRLTRRVEYGKVVDQLDSRFGRPSNPTYTGNYRIHTKLVYHESTTYDRSPMPYFMVFDSSHGGRIGFHYSASFKNVGWYGMSHGCVNIRDYGKLKKWFNTTPMGTPVHVYK